MHLRLTLCLCVAAGAASGWGARSDLQVQEPAPVAQLPNCFERLARRAVSTFIFACSIVLLTLKTWAKTIGQHAGIRRQRHDVVARFIDT